MTRNVRILFLLLCGLATSVQGQGRYDEVQIKATKVAGNVYMLVGAGGNIGVSAGEDGILMVDDEFAELSDRIYDKLKELNPGELKFVLNTHYHGDHTGGNPFFAAHSTIIAQQNTRSLLKSGGSRKTPSPEEGWPMITFDSTMSIYFNGEEIKAVYAPHVHTAGDALIYFTHSNVLQTGDLMFSGMFPFVDVDNGGQVQSLIDYVDKLLKELPKDIKIIPGHGPLSTYEDLQKYHQMLSETTAFIRKGVKDGLSLDELKSRGVPGVWKDWGWEFVPEQRWVEIVYNSYSKS